MRRRRRHSLVLTVLLVLVIVSYFGSHKLPDNIPLQKPSESATLAWLNPESSENSVLPVVESAVNAVTTNIPSAGFDLSKVPEYTGDQYCEINNNNPFFSDSERTVNEFENYSDLDSLGRCGVAYANICKDTMPTEKRGDIGMIKPSGWHTVKYPDLISDRYLYNRCHLIGYQLAGENANPKNLITGTRYLNITGMLPFEDEVAEYVKNTDHHVLYRVTPIFSGDELVARGVLMEGESVEDNTVKFCAFVYNVQPGIKIDYATGDSERA